jgi:uncharacterized protein YciI
VADYQLVTMTHGPTWDPDVPRREQAEWDEHAAFMDALVADGTVVLGGPMGDVDLDDVLVVFDAPDEATVRQRLADDPWTDRILTIKSVQPWTIWLRRS